MMTERAAVAGISGARASCRTRNARSVGIAPVPHRVTRPSASLLARFVLIRIELRTNAMTLSQMTSSPRTPRTSSLGLTSRKTRRTISVSDVTNVGTGSVTHQTRARRKQARAACPEAASPAGAGAK